MNMKYNGVTSHEQEVTMVLRNMNMTYTGVTSHEH